MNTPRSVSIVVLFSISIHVVADTHALRNWESYPDFTTFRTEAGRNENFTSVCETGRPTREMVSFMNDKKWSDAVAIGLSWLESCPVDIRIHYYTAISLDELGREPESEVHFRWVDGLLESILVTGDGETEATAYVTISVTEEYDVLYLANLKPTNQALLQGKTLLDVFTAENEEGKEYTIYFNPVAHFNRLDNLLKEIPDNTE